MRRPGYLLGDDESRPMPKELARKAEVQNAISNESQAGAQEAGPATPEQAGPPSEKPEKPEKLESPATPEEKKRTHFPPGIVVAEKAKLKMQELQTKRNEHAAKRSKKDKEQKEQHEKAIAQKKKSKEQEMAKLDGLKDKMLEVRKAGGTVSLRNLLSGR